MNPDQFTRYMLQRLGEISSKHPGRTSRHAYEQGVLIGLLITLAEYDSKNFDILKRKLDKLSAKDFPPEG